MPPSERECALRLGALTASISVVADTNSDGIRFTINRDGNRSGTIGLRISHTEDYSKVVGYIRDATKAFKCETFLEQIAVNKSYKTDQVSHRKIFCPELRTIYVILRPPKRVFTHLSTTLSSVKGYGALDRLETSLSEVK